MESWCPPPPGHGSNPHPSSSGPGHYVGHSGESGYSDTCHDWLPGCPGFTGGGAGQSGEQRIGPGYYRLTGASPTRTTRAVRRDTTSLLGANCVGRLFALGACPQQIQDTIKDLDRSNLPVWAPFAVLGGLIAAPLIPEVAGPLIDAIFGSAAEDAGLSAADQSSLDYATTPSKLDHIFAAKHNFGPLVEQFGSREAVVQQFLNGLKGLTPGSGTFEQQIVVGGQKIIVRGAVVNGITKIGTAFTP
jgi:hypothetical protein